MRTQHLVVIACLASSLRRLWLLALAASAFVACAAGAQTFALDWFAIAPAGGASSGGSYQLAATLGQPLAGTMQGGAYSVVGGFDSVLGELAPAQLPRLRLALAPPNSVQVSWPAAAQGWVLQQSSNLGPAASWTDVTATVVVIGTDSTVTLPRTVSGQFFRLRHP